ncbi:MAG: hypothetical protein M3066_18025, partial [Actinomycetota bacterium]|nr:hypothetical protein [Actinomycetota bacterium]
MLLTSALALVACGGGSGQGGAVATSTPSTTKSAGPTTLLPGSATSATTTPASGVTTSTAPSLGVPAGVQPYTAERVQKVPPATRLTGVRTGRQEGYDRIVFDFSGPLPGSESVQYVAGVTQDGSGAPVPLNGEAFLKAVFSVAEAHDDGGALSFPQGKRFDPGLTTVKEVALAGDFEGYVSFGLGVAGKVSFRVFE